MLSNRIQILRESLGNPSFQDLLEAVLTESMVGLSDWESNSTKWDADENEKPKRSGDIQIDAAEFIQAQKPGDSISRIKYVFLPTEFAMSQADGVHILAHISELLKDKGNITVSVRPGFGVEDEHTAYPARWYKNFTADSKHLVNDQLGNGAVIYAIDGVPLSQWLKKTVTMDAPIDVNPKTEWLAKIVKAINDAQTDVKVKSERPRIPGFTDDAYRILSTTEGDSVLLISPIMANAAYILKKKMKYNEAVADYDVAAHELMTKYIADWKRKPRGTKREDLPAPNLEEKRQPRLRFRDWLDDNGNINGYALRRDYHTGDIENLIKGGINYADGKKLIDAKKAAQPAPTPTPAQ